MGRKKRKVTADGEAAADEVAVVAEVQGLQDPLPLLQDASSSLLHAAASAPPNSHENKEESKTNATTKATSSNYAVTSHSGEIIQEDIYVSDGSDDDDEYAEIVLAGSRMGIMRRGLHAPQALQQPNRQWTRATDGSDSKNKDGGGGGNSMKPKLTEQEELEQLDPAARAARLALEKQRREQEAILEARREENEANVLRSPALFSKRTAFDIRFDQIEEKPWERNLTPGEQASAEQLSEYFNYGLSEEDWLEYSQQQLLIRQELIEANRQKRKPDPNIVPVQPRKKEEGESNTDTAGVEAKPEADTNGGEALQQTAENTAMVQSQLAQGALNKNDDSVSMDDPQPVAGIMAPQKLDTSAVNVVADLGGAWGAGATPGSVLARLMEEQEQLQQQQHAPLLKQQQQQPPLQQERESTANTPSSATRRDSLGGATTSSYGGSHADAAGERYASHTDDSHNPYYNNSRYVAPPPPPPEEDYHFRGGRSWQQPPPPQPIASDPYYPPQQQHQQQHQQPYFGGRGRGSYRGGGRGGGFRGYQAPPGGAGGYDPRKRPRDDPRWTRDGPR